MDRRTILASAALLIAYSSTALPQHPTAPSAQVVLVELFTSEGCSSCPPADSLLRKLDGTVTATGQSVIVLSEHVTYWNHGGWSDPFSKEEFTARQETYVRNLRLESAYTPQMVINGERDVVGSNANGLTKAIESTPPLPLSVRIVSVTRHGGDLSVRVSLDGSHIAHRAGIFTAVALNHASSTVSDGENGGRTLANAAVAQRDSKWQLFDGR